MYVRVLTAYYGVRNARKEIKCDVRARARLEACHLICNYRGAEVGYLTCVRRAYAIAHYAIVNTPSEPFDTPHENKIIAGRGGGGGGRDIIFRANDQRNVKIRRR